jgi:hypothetical protein
MALGNSFTLRKVLRKKAEIFEKENRARGQAGAVYGWRELLLRYYA